MYIGNVTVWPDVKLVMTKSSIDRLKASSAAAMIPGRISGKVTFQKVVQLVRAEVHRRLLEVASGSPTAGPGR